MRNLIAAILFASLAATASAAPTRQRSTAQTRQKPTATARLRRPAAKPRFSGNPLQNPTHLSKVNARLRTMKKWVYEGQPNGDGTVGYLAAYAELIPANGISQTETVSLSYDDGNHASDTSQRLRVTGVKDGKWRGHLVGIVSTHDLTSLDGKDFTDAVDKRISADYVQVSFDYGPGTQKTVLASKIPSKAATGVAIEVPLNKNGITRVIYDRTDANGYAVGSSDAYLGRIVELEWNGK